MRKIAAGDGLLVTGRSHAVQDVVWSTAVQHGPNATIVNRALLALGGGQAVEPASRENDRKLIVAIYAERGRRDSDGRLAHFRRNSRRVQESVAQRFIDEQRDALAMLDRSA